MLAAKNVSLSEPVAFAYEAAWLESRPAESGRSVVVTRNADGKAVDLLPPGYSVRSGVHEYGGAAWLLVEDKLIFCNSADQQIYCQELNTATSPRQVTVSTACRYADLQWSARLQRLIAVQEDHRQSGEPVNRLVCLDITQNEAVPETLIEGADFYANPRISVEGSSICWLQWNHPQMPWFGCQLYRGDLSIHGVSSPRLVAGGDEESIFQPDWHGEQLLFCSDASASWQLWRNETSGNRKLSHFDGECGLPQWQFGMRTWCVTTADTALCAVCRQGIWSLQRLDLDTGESHLLHLPFSAITHISAFQGGALILAGLPQAAPAIYRVDLSGRYELVAQGGENRLQQEDISVAQPLQLDGSNGPVHAFYYPPQHRLFCPLADEKPPLIVLCHGGPTAATTNVFNLKVQFWTSRGFTVADVNYRGSTGYGRTYRTALDGQWGIADVEDACATAQWLADQGLADPRRLLIRGSSAGGLTVLAALTFHQVFAAGASLYGIGDLKTLAAETHKFEARYGDRLIAPWPQEADEYDRRSPIHHIDRLNAPVIFFQGLKDAVVPPNQAEMMVSALEQRGVAVALVTYSEEGHGFRAEGSIVHSFNAELAFYGALLGFKTDSTLSDLYIRNLPN